MNAATIATVQSADLPDVASLFDAYRVWYGQTPNLAAATEFLRARLETAESVILLARVDTGSGPVAAGFTQLYPIFSSIWMQRSWLLNDLFVASEYRQRGIARQLIDGAKDRARRTRAAGLLLETAPTNEIGNRLYPAVGFVREANHFYFWSCPSESNEASAGD